MNVQSSIFSIKVKYLNALGGLYIADFDPCTLFQGRRYDFDYSWFLCDIMNVYRSAEYVSLNM